jgi:hypothetical protein
MQQWGKLFPWHYYDVCIRNQLVPEIKNKNSIKLQELNRKCWSYFEDPLIEYER